MKKLAGFLVILGALFLIVALLVRFFGVSNKFFGLKLYGFLFIANTAFLLAILAKLFEKK
ncbi:MAG: hypothetical protein ABIG31_04425 [Candidatus Omnitrophota bacterium]